jgi:hypothetical protein
MIVIQHVNQMLCGQGKGCGELETERMTEKEVHNKAFAVTPTVAKLNYEHTTEWITQLTTTPQLNDNIFDAGSNPLSTATATVRLHTGSSTPYKRTAANFPKN